MTVLETALSPAGSKGRPVYELLGIGKTYAKRNVHALNNIDLSLAEGSFSATIGPSGCGKSTLLKIMTGLLSPSEGSVMLGVELQLSIEASWYTGKLRIPSGEMLQYVHMGYGTRYEKEIVLNVKKGRVVKKKIINNRGKMFNEDKLKRKELRKIAKWEKIKERSNLGITSADSRAHNIWERIKSALG